VEFQHLAFDRRSIRGFKPEPVPRALLDEIIEVAAQCPSSMNTQPWHVHAVTGDVLDRIRRGNTERMLETGRPDREIRGHGRYEGEHRERQKRVAAQLFEAAGIGWDDKAQRQDWAMRGFRQFDAPVSVIGCIDRELYDSTEAYFDLGQFVYGMVLAAWDRLPASRLEDLERLEQLRMIEAGCTIATFPVQGTSLSVDTAEQLEQARAMV